MFCWFVCVGVVLCAVFVLLSFRKWRKIARNEKRIAGKKVLVTGASAGIGREIAKCLAGLDTELVLVGRNEQRLKEAKEECLENGAKSVETVVADLSSKYFEPAVLGTEPFDVLVLNAGVSMDFEFVECERECIDAVLMTDFNNCVKIVHHFLPGMLKAKNGRKHILVVGSASADLPRRRRSLYSAAKAGLAVFFENLACEVWEQVAITVCQPGFVSGTGIADNTSRLGRNGHPMGQTGVAKTAKGWRALLPEVNAQSVAKKMVKHMLAEDSRVSIPRLYGLLALVKNICPSLYHMCVRAKPKLN